MMAGTSTGALIALGLSAPAIDSQTGEYLQTPLHTAEQLVELYRRRAIEIFPRRLFDHIRSVRQAFAGKYDAGNFDQVLLETFGERTIQDALTNVLITSFDVERARPLIMKKRPGPEGRLDPNFLMRDSVRGSAAAPTFFEPLQVRPVDRDELYTLVDGSMVANNPAMNAYVEARRIFPKARKYVIVSLGTGNPALHYTYRKMRSWGFIEWVLPSNGIPFIAIMSRGQSESVDYQLHHLAGVEYYRFDPNIDACSDQMDDASERTLACLTEVAERLIAEKSAALDELAERL